jgi:hypothetical protein
VSPKTGEIESTGIAMPEPLPNGGDLIVDPHAPIVDVRPELGALGNKNLVAKLPG